MIPGMDRIRDMSCTVFTVTGEVVAAVIICRTEEPMADPSFCPGLHLPGKTFLPGCAH